MQLGTIKEIWRYPVKSMAGETLDSATIGPDGLLGDRGWAIRDQAAGEIRGAKKIPRLLHFAARYLREPGTDEIPDVEITLPGGDRVRSDSSDVASRISTALEREVTLCALRPADDEAHYRSGKSDYPDDPMAELRAVLGIEEGDPIPDLSGIPQDLRGFATPPGTYFDCFPLHVLTTASLAQLSLLNPDVKFDVRRFRPNIFIDVGADHSGFVEFDWTGKTLHIGAAAVQIETSSVRCAMTMHSQPGLEQDRGVMRTMVEHSGQHLGSYATIVTPGRVSLGDTVRLE